MILSNPQATDSILVVEGLNDRHVIRHLCERADPGLTFGIHDYEGIENVINQIRAYVNSPDRPAVGFVLDADEDPIRTWGRVAGQVRSAVPGIPLSVGPDPNGVVIPANPDVGSPRVGVWLMPDNTTEGELENFVADMIPAGDSVWPLAQQYIDGIPPMDRKFAENKTLRAQIHAWLAAREDPRQMGLAIRTRDLDVGNPLSLRFLGWLSRLFR